MKKIMALALLLTTILLSCSTMKKMETSKASDLNGTWNLVYITGPRITFEGLFPNSKPYLVFDAAQKHVSGNNSCNVINSGYKVVGDSLKFGNMISTMKSCLNNGNGENVFMQALKNVDRFQIMGDTLHLYHKDVDIMHLVKAK